MGREVTPNASNAPRGGETARAPRLPRGRAGALLAILPWLFASAVSAATLSVDLTPGADELRLDAPRSEPRRAPPAPPAPPASGRGRGGSDDLYFDVRALISV